MDKKEGLGIIPGKISNADIVYFNGVEIGRTGKFPPQEVSMWNHTRFYRINQNLIRYNEENSIAIRVSYSVFGEIRGEMSILNLRDWEKKKDHNLLIIIINFFVISIMAAIGIIFLMIYIRRREWTEYKFFLLQLLPGFFVIYEICGFIWPIFGSMEVRMRINGIMWSSLVLFHLIFLHRLYELKRKKIEMGLYFILVINTILLLFSKNETGYQYYAIAVIISITPLALYNISIHIIKLFSGNFYAKFLILPGIVLSMTAAHDGVFFLSRFLGADIILLGYNFDKVIFSYGAGMMFVGASIILVDRFLNTMAEVEDLNLHLEVKVENRTRDLKKSLHNLSNIIDNIYIDQRMKITSKEKGSISKSTEGKIKKAILYINENYTYDISREGLASYVEINTDHFGKVFKIYTGKKISDFINELRIKNAAILLKESDENIIDIAFKVGFESLRTFNRIFLKIMNVNPRDFRSK